LQEATLDIGSEALARASLAVTMNHQVELVEQHVLGMMLPKVSARLEAATPQFGITGTSSNTDLAMLRFVELLELIARYAELETAVLRLSRELKRTQRRCNALSKLFIPSYRETISYIEGALEERERESFVIQKIIRDRLRAQAEPEM
jgi:V/A-type H+-transporting ATPase subunit D